MIKIKRVLPCVFAILFILSGFGVASADSRWYEDYTTEHGTKLTRDFTFGLKSDFAAAPSDDVFENFKFFRSELPEELPVFAPYNAGEIDNSRIKLYVSTDGKDNNPGTIDKPFKTIARAVEYAKRLEDKSGGLTIYLREGTYSVLDGINIPLELSGTEENPTFISSYNNENVVITTAVAINGSDMEIAKDSVADAKLQDSVKDKVYSIDLKKLGYEDFGTFTETLRPALYVDGVAYTVSRWPNGENTRMAKYEGADGENGVIETGDILTAAGGTGTYTGDTGTGFEFVVASNRPFNWENTGNIWMYGYWYEEWAKYHKQVESFDSSRSSVKSVNHCNYGAQYVDEKNFYFYNILEELDIPGEWYIDDKTGILYLYPISDLNSAKVMITTNSNSIITISNAKNVVINGLELNTGGNHGVHIQNGKKNIVQDCEISNVGGKAVQINGTNNGVLCNRLRGSVLVQPVSTPNTSSYKTLTYSRNFVQNNYVEGQVMTSFGLQNIVSHNVITAHSAQCLYSTREMECIYEYNEIVAGPNVNIDSGMIYVGCTALQRGSHIRYNYLNKSVPDGYKIPVGIYCDDMSSYNMVYGNILRQTDIFFHGGSNNVVYNNMIVDDTYHKAPIYNSDNYQVTAERWGSLVLSDTDTRWARQQRSTYQHDWMLRYVDDYEWHSQLLKHKYEYEKEGYDSSVDDLGKYMAAPKRNYYGYNLLVRSNPIFHAKTEIMSTYEHNKDLSEDPGFVDIENGLYDLKSGSVSDFNPGMEDMKPQSKMGVIFDEAFPLEKLDLEKPNLISPQNTTDELVYTNENITLMWSSVFGKSFYTVQVAKDKSFSDIIFETEVQSVSTLLPAVDADSTYYWRVIAKTWSNNMDTTPAESETGIFKVASITEIEEHAVVDTYDISNLVNRLNKQYENIKQDYENTVGTGVYKTDALETLSAIIAEATDKINNGGFKRQNQVESYVFDTERKFYSAWSDAVENAGTVTLNNENQWYVANNEMMPAPTADNGMRINHSKSGVTGMIMLDEPLVLRPKQKVKLKVKYDKLGGWTTIQLAQLNKTASGPTAGAAYFTVFKSDAIELQRTPRDEGWTNAIISNVENNGIVKNNQWFDFEYSIDYTMDGTHVIVYVDSKELFNYTDATNANYGFGYFGFMHNGANGGTEFMAHHD